MRARATGDTIARSGSARWCASALAVVLLGCPTVEPQPAPRPVDWQTSFDLAPQPDLGACAALPDYVAAGDLDGDGHVDLAVNAVGQELCLLRGLGDGSFEFAALLQDDMGHNAMALGDVQGDGLLDVLAGNIAGAGLPVFDNLGAFDFASPTYHPAGDGPFIPIVAHLDGDAHPDVAVINADSDDLSVLLGAPGGLQPERRFDGQGDEPSGIDAVDLDGDGALDLVHSNFGSDDLTIHWGDGAGGFDTTSLLATGALPASSRAGDLDGDGDLDLATANEDGGDVSLLFNRGARAFDDAISLPLGDRPFFIVPADLDGRGTDELVVPVEGEGVVVVLAHDGDGSLEVVVELPAGHEPSTATVADFNGDGRPDIVVANYSSGDLSLYLSVLE